MGRFFFFLLPVLSLSLGSCAIITISQILNVDIVEVEVINSKGMTILKSVTLKNTSDKTRYSSFELEAYSRRHSKVVKVFWVEGETLEPNETRKYEVNEALGMLGTLPPKDIYVSIATD